ncbi:MAG: Na/Pi cotransporter family protein [Gammaproteobacteria bacterium]|nr:Na/Pi cotransporter family protein [Gammaproteobacteria bacterium]MDH3449243.1 Na/Pi cotransporter family protein [Gammaproteobacteria bacterium]
MLKKIILPTILLVLAYGFWISPDFKEIAAGVAIFLFGMLFLEDGFKAFTGGVLEKLLQKTTNKTWKSLLFGVVSTSIMQSSSLVSVITISFISAGLVTLVAGIGIIFGANIGTTTGAWLVAAFGLKVKISAYAMPMLVFGIVLSFQKSRYLKGAGAVLAGLGFLFLGIHHMKEGFEAFKDSFDLASLAVGGYPGLFLFAAIGAAATVVMQSSHATLVLILTALAASQITYENGLALAIGANVGTTITAIIGSLSANIQGRRLAGAHLIFNVVTGVVAIVFINQFIWAVDTVSSSVGIAGDNYTMKLAVFHTLFNLVGVLLMVPLIHRLSDFLVKSLPEKEKDIAEPLYLSEAAIEFPETVLRALKKEVWHLFDSAFEIMAHGINLHRRQILNSEDLEKTIDEDREVHEFDLDELYESKVKVLYSAIVDFISNSQAHMPSVFSEEMFRLRKAAGEIVECVKHIKHLRKNATRYMLSDNEHIRNEYNQLRYQISMILREIYRLRGDEDFDHALALLEMDELKAEIQSAHAELDARVTGILRDDRITPTMATSLLNDFNYVDETSRHLLDTAQALLVSHSDLVAEAAREVVLDEDEIEKASAA